MAGEDIHDQSLTGSESPDFLPISIPDTGFVRMAQTELVAVEAGHGPVQREIAGQLVDFSMSKQLIEETLRAVKTDQAHLSLLHNFGNMLPTTNGLDEVFTIDGPNKEYLARQIQANTLWLGGRNRKSAQVFGARYIIGRSIDTQNPNLTRLLLLPADGMHEIGINRPHLHVPDPIILSVGTADLRERDKVAVGIEKAEFSDEDITDMLDVDTGKIKIKGNSLGCIRIIPYVRGESTREFVIEKGVRTPDRRHIAVETIRGGISYDTLEKFGATTAMAKLALAFKVKDGYEKLLKAIRSEEPLT